MAEKKKRGQSIQDRWKAEVPAQFKTGGKIKDPALQKEIERMRKQNAKKKK